MRINVLRPSLGVTMTLVLALAPFARGQSVVDPTLKVQTWTKGLSQPTGMAFVDDAGTALVLEKSTGRVRIVANKQVTGTALDLPVANDSERGLLGIALSPTFSSDKLVYLYYTASTQDGGKAYDNRIERYKWNGSTLSLDRRVIRLPIEFGPMHDGGKIAFGPDKKLYTVIGDLGRMERTQNLSNSAILRTGSILRINPSGTSVPSNPFYSTVAIGGPKEAINDIYAYGIRNSFGLAFDPVTGSLWDTENGPESWDEINRVTPGFNSGWRKVQGPLARQENPDDITLFDMGEAAHYEDPKFSWKATVAPTDAFFMDTARLGQQYAHDLFVGSLRGGNIYHFDLTRTRKSLRLGGALADLVADNTTDARGLEQDQIRFGSGFGTVTDILSGPGGMYVLSLSGSMYRITTDPSMLAGAPAPDFAHVSPVPEPNLLALLIPSLALARARRCRPAQ